MILYVQTPAIPRTDVHNVCIKTMIQTIDRLEEFSEIRWFVNLDVITTHTPTHTWQDYKLNEENFKDIAKGLKKTSLYLNTSHDPCFYLAYRHLTLSVIEDVKKHNLLDDDYCVMWLEDDWMFIDTKCFRWILPQFLKMKDKLVFTLHGSNFAASSADRDNGHPGKLNMGGNPDIIKGSVHKLFEDVDLSKDNKRDPELIRKFDVWYPYILQVNDKWPKETLWQGHENGLQGSPEFETLNKILDEVNPDWNHPLRVSQTNVITSNVTIGIVGDIWRNDKAEKTSTSYDKLGIDASKSYTYK